MRIAIFTETFLPKWDGVASTLCHLLEYLAEKGHTSLMFAPEDAPDRYAETSIVGLPSFTFPLYPDLELVPPVVPKVDIESRLSDFRPDVIHLVNPASLGLVGLRYAHELEIPIVASYQTDIPGYALRYGLGALYDPLWAYFRWIHNQADLNLAPSHYTKAQLEAHGFERVKVWSHGVDSERFNPHHSTQEWRQRLSGGDPEKTLLLYVGRLAREKRVEWLRPLLDELSGISLAIVGDGPIRPDLEECFANTSTVFTGFLEGDDLSSAYASGDIFVFPSATETLGIVVLEAMASGLPVIAPRSGGPVDHVQDNENGFLFDPDDIADMMALVERLVSDQSLVERLGSGARAYAETQSWEDILDELLEHYIYVIDHHIPLESLRIFPSKNRLSRN